MQAGEQTGPQVLSHPQGLPQAHAGAGLSRCCLRQTVGWASKLPTPSQLPQGSDYKPGGGQPIHSWPHKAAPPGRYP